MERGLLWLPLLGIFSWLAWAGWNEYRKLEAYKQWAVDFERAKYDVYAVLGQQKDNLVWGIPTRSGPIALQHISLRQVQAVTPWLGDRPLPPTASVPKGCRVALELTIPAAASQWIPFTDADLASSWQKQLQKLIESLQSTPQL